MATSTVLLNSGWSVEMYVFLKSPRAGASEHMEALSTPGINKALGGRGWLQSALLAGEPLLQLPEDGVARLLRVLVVALAVLGLVVPLQVVLLEHGHDFSAD